MVVPRDQLVWDTMLNTTATMDDEGADVDDGDLVFGQPEPKKLAR